MLRWAFGIGVLTLIISATASAGSTKMLQNKVAGIASVLEENDEVTATTEAATETTETTSAKETQEITVEEEAQDLWGYTNLGIAKVDNHLNVRETGDENGKLVGKMSKNTACEILSIDGNWANVKSGKVTGYVNTDFLYLGDEAVKKAKEVVSVVATIRGRTVKLREKPSTDAIVLTLVDIDEEFEVEKVLDGWVQILLDDETAFVSSDYVEVKEQLGTAVTLTELLYGGGVSNLRVDLVQFAKKHVGNPYVWGGTSLTKGADCSGFVLSVYKNFGISMPRTSREQVSKGTKISLSQAQPGDLVFYAKNGSINHVAIYIGNGQVVHASSPRTGIKISNATYRTPFAVKRVLP